MHLHTICALRLCRNIMNLSASLQHVPNSSFERREAHRGGGKDLNN